jgi:hypothetical protein
MTTPRLTDVPVTTPEELCRRWAAVLAPPVFTARSLWIMWLNEDGSTLPLIVPVDDLPPRFGERDARGVLELATVVRDEQTGGSGHVAFALCRPGHATCTPGDQELSDGLARGATGVGLSSWSLHLAAGGTVVPLVAPPWPRDEQR